MNRKALISAVIGAIALAGCAAQDYGPKQGIGGLAGAGLGADELDAVEVGARYTLGPGVTLAGGLQWWDFRDNLGAVGAENEALIFIFGTTIAF